MPTTPPPPCAPNRALRGSFLAGLSNGPGPLVMQRAGWASCRASEAPNMDLKPKSLAFLLRPQALRIASALEHWRWCPGEKMHIHRRSVAQARSIKKQKSISLHGPGMGPGKERRAHSSVFISPARVLPVTQASAAPLACVCVYIAAQSSLGHSKRSDARHARVLARTRHANAGQ